MISISISPNTEKDDVFLSLKLIFSFFKWKKGKAEKDFKKLLKNYFNLPYVFLHNSGRSSLYVLLKALNLNNEDEVLLQSFTCSALVNPILWNNLTPIYVDIKDNFNIDPEDLRKKITKKSKVLIIQHTFGYPCEMEEIEKIVKENNLILIEDCAHSLGAEYKGKKIGTFGQASFLSFSRDKIISSVYGGAIITKNTNIAKQIKEQNYPSRLWIFQQLLHPILMNLLIIPFYGFLGKPLLVIFQKTKILSKAVSDKEKQGERPNYFPKKMPNAIATLACHQFNKIDKFYSHRKKITNLYIKELKLNNSEKENIKQTYLRFVFTNNEAHKIIKTFWEKNILIGDWYTSPIAPDDTNLKKMLYRQGSCPMAEKYSQITLNLPTHINISEKKAHKIISYLKKIN